MPLMLHCGAEPIDYENLRALTTPPATPTHYPLAHADLVDRVTYALRYYGHEVTGMDFGLTPDQARFFGVLTLKSAYGDYTDMVGLRNAHDKRFPVGVSFGSRVFVCDNLAFSSDSVIRRKHTANARRDLPGLISEVVEPLAAKRAAQAAGFQVYHETRLSMRQVDHGIMQMFRQGAINLTRIGDVLDAYEHPPEQFGDTPWGEETAWRLFNAATYSLEGRVSENPDATRIVHKVCDQLCLA
jgi:hypothetical protein